MKIHSTNYKNTFIAVAEDCPVVKSEIPPVKNNQKSIANIQYEIIAKNPYRYSSDEVLFHCFLIRNRLKATDFEREKTVFFSKGQPCFRSSPLTKRYGFGIHFNDEEKMALYGMETEEYQYFLNNPYLKIVKTMYSKKA